MWISRDRSGGCAKPTVSDGQLSTIDGAVSFLRLLGTSLGRTESDRISFTAETKDHAGQRFDSKYGFRFSPLFPNPREKPRDIMETGVLARDAGQLDIPDSNRLVESEDSSRISFSYR